MELNICHLYPDILNLYGDRGNIITMKRRLEGRGIKVNIDECSIGQPLNADKYDIFFIGGGQDFEQEVLLSDTVGFIRKLPTHLIEAFKATLEELSYADVLLHVIDISNPEWEAQARVVDGLISQLGASETPCLRVFNKCDAYIGILPHGDDIVCISARSGEGADALVSKLLEMLDRGKKQVRLEIPYSDAGIVDLLKREAAVLSMEYTDTGITAEAIVTPDVLGRVKKYIPGYVEPKEDWE